MLISGAGGKPDGLGNHVMLAFVMGLSDLAQSRLSAVFAKFRTRS